MKVAINGFGRIGRLVFRRMFEDSTFEIVAINDLTTKEDLAYLLRYDTMQGRYPHEISTFENGLVVDGKKIIVLSESDPSNLPWCDLEIDLVMECTGRFVKEEDSNKHLLAGAKKVLISAPGKGDMKTIVYSVNEDTLDGSEKIISAASCTTNCLAPVLKVLDQEFGIVKGFMTTVHAYTNDQATLDIAHKKGIYSRRGRACAMNIVPTETGAAKAIGKVLSNLDNKMSGGAIRVPVATGSMIDLVLELKETVSEEAINKALEANSSSSLKVIYDPIVSSDVIGTTYGAIVDGLLTKVITTDETQLVKVVAWYDNEMGYSAQMVRLAKYLSKML